MQCSRCGKRDLEVVGYRKSSDDELIEIWQCLVCHRLMVIVWGPNDPALKE